MKIELPHDLKDWAVLSCPIKGLRIDPRMLELIDTNGDGHIRTDELMAAVDYLNAHEGDASEAAAADVRLMHYREHLPEFVDNFVSTAKLDSGEPTVYQVGVLRIDGRECKLVFQVGDEAAHSELAGKSNCYVIYLSLAAAEGEAPATICAVVTAGKVHGLYVGRHGVYYDRDGKIWEAVITKVVENQVSLVEAFWLPWRKLGETISSTVKKYLGDRQSKADAAVSALMATPTPVTPPTAASGNGAALASSVAAVGIGIGMLGAAAGAVMSAVAGMEPWQVAASLAVIVLAVSLPSVVLTWFKLRKRDLGAILNASGWAVNHPIRISMRRARKFTVC